ncbi:MAG: BatA domain-containing protein [Pirellulales bacterium]
MGFVTPALLAGSFMVVVPIAIHLAMRRRPRRIEFPALRFLTGAQEQNRRRLRLRHLLLLLLRSGAILLLALALARPTIRGSGWLGGEESPVAAALVFDTAPRMAYRHENATRLQAAQQIGLWLIRQLPRDSQIGVLESRGTTAAFSVDRGAATQRVERLDIQPAARPLPEAIERAVSLLEESDKPRKEIYVFTDRARAAWPEDRIAVLRARLGETGSPEIYLIDVGVDQPINSGLGELQLSSQVLARQMPLRLTVPLEHVGPKTDRAVELFVLDRDGHPQKRAHEMAQWKSGPAGSLEFPPLVLDEGTHQGFVRILGEDGLVWDDTRYFSVAVKPAWRILIGAASPADALFLVEAIAPHSARQAGRSRFDCQVVSFDRLNEQRLDDYASVCLLDPLPFAEDDWKRLGDYAESGHGIAIFLGHNARPVAPFHQGAARRLLPGDLKRQWREPSYLAPNNLQHPVLAKFASVEGSIPWQAFPVFRYWQFGPLDPGVVTILPYATRHPALLEKPLGAGRVVTMTTPISDRLNLRGREPWNALPTGTLEPWPFVVLSNELMFYLVGRGETKLNYLSGETAVLPIATQLNSPLVLLETPDGQRIRRSVDQHEQSLVLTSIQALGNYRVRAGGNDEGLDVGFSVNLASDATWLARCDRDELVAQLGNDHVQIARNESEISRRVNVGRVGYELFPGLILLVAVALGVEHLLANRFYSESRPAAMGKGVRFEQGLGSRSTGVT